MSAESNQVTDLLGRWRAGDDSAREALIPVVYDELRRIAKRCLAGRPPQTLQSTALVHEAYMRLVRQPSLQVENRDHFFGMAARMMRGILIDHARARGAWKRGANALTLTFDEALFQPDKPKLDLLVLDDALTRLAVLDARQAEIVELRFFGGLSIEETSRVLEISPATVKREWMSARLWLNRELRNSELA